MQTWGKRPIGRGRCSGRYHEGVSRDGVLIFELFTDGSGLCGPCRALHYRQVFAGLREEQRPPERDSRGLTWDSNYRGGSWRL